MATKQKNSGCTSLAWLVAFIMCILKWNGYLLCSYTVIGIVFVTLLLFKYLVIGVIIAGLVGWFKK